MNKRLKILLLLIVTVLLLLLMGCSNTEISLNDKVKSEIDYFNIRLINIINKLNNITFENYYVTAEKTNFSKETAQNEKSSESSSQNTADVKGSESENTTNNTTLYQMSPNTVLNPVLKEISWKSIKNEIENLYYSWNTTILDLYELNIKNEDILGFSSDLDVATQYIKNEDKDNSILAIANLYKYLPKYAEIVANEDEYSNILKTKSFILNAYAFVDAEYWTAVEEEIDKAIETYKYIMNDTKYISENSYRVNKVYVLLNELKNSTDLKDMDIFYIKYKNLMEELVEM